MGSLGEKDEQRYFILNVDSMPSDIHRLHFLPKNNLTLQKFSKLARR